MVDAAGQNIPATVCAAWPCGECVDLEVVTVGADFLGDPEQVIRHRGGGRDENGKLLTEIPPVTLAAIAVAPGGGSDRQSLGRTGEDIACTVYFPLGTDLVNADELTVRGERFRIVVNDWQLDGFGGLEVLCSRGQG